jgi:ribosomal-protein-alanine N-acetyltransferase
MSEHDLSEVVALEEAAGLSRWGWEAYHRELQSQESTIMIVARHRGRGVEKEIVGFIAARVTGDELHINNIATREDFRGRGIGGALLQNALREGIRRGARISLLEVRISNEAAKSLYLSKGFVPIGIRRRYYSDPVEDAVVMKFEHQS